MVALVQRVSEWWAGQAMGWLPSGATEILITGHYHHPRVYKQGKRTWFQCPRQMQVKTYYKEQDYGTILVCYVLQLIKMVGITTR